MKYFYLIFLPLWAFTSCNKDIETADHEALRSETNPLIGKWQLFEHSYSIGTAEQFPVAVENGYTFDFKNDGTFESNKKILKSGKDGAHFELGEYEQCTGGTFEIKGDQLILNFICNSGTLEYIDVYEFDDGHLILSPRSPVMCVEGCSSKFKRID